MIEFRKTYLITLQSGATYAVGVAVDDPCGALTDAFYFLLSASSVDGKDFVSQWINLFGGIATDHPSYDGSDIVHVEEIRFPASIEDWNTLRWTRSDSSLAEREGWNIFMYDDTAPEIQRVDEIDAFESDRDALRWVWRRAENGSEFHENAINALQSWYP